MSVKGHREAHGDLIAQHQFFDEDIELGYQNHCLEGVDTTVDADAIHSHVLSDYFDYSFYAAGH